MGKSQLEIAGTERPVNKRIENVMQTLSDKKKTKTRANSAHKDAEQRVIEVMREEKVAEYTSEDLGLTVTLDDIEKVKLAAYTPPKDDKKPKAEA
jgi:hypothetical protein